MMKKIVYWTTLISAFAIGYMANEYRHQYLAPKGDGIEHPIQVIAPANPTGNIQATSQLPTDQPSNQVSQVLSKEKLHELINHQEYQTAIDQLKRYLQTHPSDVQAWYWLASSYQSQGKLTLAVEAWLKYLEYEVDSEGINNAITNLKRLLQQLAQTPALNNDNPDWLVTQINKLLDISINDGQLHLMLAQRYLDTDDDYQAQYHALMAANQPDTAPQAEKILAQLNGDISDEPIELSLTRYGDQFIVAVYIENNPANLLLDTGASISGVTNRYVAKYPFMVKNSKPIQLNTASGTKESYLFTVENLQLGNIRFAQHMLAVLPMNDFTEFDGLLGVDILGKFDFVLDQNNSVLKLNPRKP